MSFNFPCEVHCNAFYITLTWNVMWITKPNSDHSFDNTYCPKAALQQSALYTPTEQAKGDNGNEKLPDVYFDDKPWEEPILRCGPRLTCSEV